MRPSYGTAFVVLGRLVEEHKHIHIDQRVSDHSPRLIDHDFTL